MTDRERIVTLAILLGTHERSTVVYEYIAGRRLRFDQRGDLVEIAEQLVYRIVARASDPAVEQEHADAGAR